MGGNELSPQEVFERLESKGWLPENSKEPLGYIRYTLSSNKAIFKSRKRGRYHLDPSNPYATGDHEAPIEGHINPKTTKPKETTPVPVVEVLPR